MATSEPDGTEEEVEAVVSAIKGEEGNRFAVAYPTQDSALISKKTTITFSLSEWKGNREPRRGQIVLLADIEKFAKGWRARRARPIRMNRKEN